MTPRTIDTSKPIRKPVEITGCPEALDYVTNLQLAEFEETLLAKRVEELPISMLMSFVGHQWWSRMLATRACYYGFVDYCKEVTDKMILDNRVFTGFMCDAGGCWTDPTGVVAIDWAREKILLGPKETSFAKMTVSEFNDLLSSDAASIYWIPGTGERNPTAPSDWNSWYGKFNHGGISRDHYYRVNSHSLGDGACDNIMDKDKPWFLLKEEWEEILRRRAKLTRPNTVEEKKAAMASQKGIYMMKWIDTENEALPRAVIRRIDAVEVVSMEAAKRTEAEHERLFQKVYNKKMGGWVTDWVNDKEVVKVTCREVSSHYDGIKACPAYELFRINDWVPFDDPSIMRLKSCPTEKMPMHKVTEYSTNKAEWFTCSKKIAEQLYDKFVQMNPVDTVKSRFSEAEELLRNAAKKGKVNIPYDYWHERDSNTSPNASYVYSDRNGNLFVYTGYSDDRSVACKPYPKKSANKFFKAIKDKYEGKWAWYRDSAVRIDRLEMKEQCKRTDLFKDELKGGYILPEITMYGRMIDISFMRPQERDNYSIDVRMRDKYSMKNISLESSLTEMDRYLTVTTFDEIVDRCHQSGKTAVRDMRKCYNTFVQGFRDLLDGKSPEFKVDRPKDTLKGE